MTEREIFFEALEITAPEARAAYLHGACGEDVALRRKVDELLKEHYSNDNLLADPAWQEQGNVDVRSPLAEVAAPVLGRYKLLERIGEGGFGEVWMAEQREPVKRRVALKIIKLGMESRQIVARFEAERQALAMMDHPNIARIFDAAVTETGRPYFVMELVRGTKITQYCDQNELPTRERLKLFIEVCRAIQHAHQKGIIHRDIKPSNILVTLHDGVPVPKVIDFGIAKATQQELTDKTLFTQFQQFIGTPAYISPEQAEMSGLDIDTRVDIYSLGVLLYELLVGQTPFDPKEMLKGGLDALRRIIREKDPLRPSTKLNTLTGEARTTAGKRRRTDTARLVHQLQGDLDWIVMKCLEKDRTRRYETANGLAMDIQRYLANEPVVARPPSTVYKFRKAWQRNKLVFTAGAVVAITMVIGSGVSVWQAMRATRAKMAETQQRLAADSEREHALAAQRLAESARASAEEMRRIAEARAYAGDMNLAQQALAADNLGLATELLDRYRPKRGQADRRGWEWRYLWQHSRSDALYTLCQQSNSISGLAVSPDGKWLAIDAGEVSIWNLVARREVARVPGARNVAFSPARPWLAMWDSQGSASSEPRYRLRLWDGETERFIPPPPSPDRGPSERLLGLAFAPDGESVITASSPWAAHGNELARWRVSDGKELAVYPIQIRGPGIGLPVNIAQSSSGVAVAENERQIRVIDSESGSEKLRLHAPGKGWLEAVALSADGATLAASSGTDETTIRLWAVASGRELGVLEGHRAYVIALVFWPDGKTLASAGADQTIRIWNVAERRCLAVLHGQKAEIYRLVLLPDNSTLISGGKDGSVMVWDTTAVQRKKSVVTLPTTAFGFWAPGNAGDSILTLGGKEWLTRWSAPDFQQAESFFQIDPAPAGVCLSADQRLLAAGGTNGVIKLWDVPHRKFLREIPIGAGPVSPRGFLAEGARLAAWNQRDRTLAVLEVATGRKISAWQDPQDEWGPLDISPDGKWCRTSSTNGSTFLRDLSTGREIGLLPARERTGAAFSPDGKQMAVPFNSGLVRRWDLPTLTERTPFKGFLRAAHSVAFSPDERRLAVGSAADESLKLWDLESGQPMLTLPGEGGPCWETAFSADGNLLVTRHELGTLDIWRIPSWGEIEAAEKAEAMSGSPSAP